jgi:mRNA interferase MazF
MRHGQIYKRRCRCHSFSILRFIFKQKRPALIVADLQGNDVILCQITSKKVNDSYGISLVADDFKSGKLPVDSNIRPNRLFTGESKIIIKRAGKLQKAKLDEVISKTVEIFENGKLS